MMSAILFLLLLPVCAAGITILADTDFYDSLPFVTGCGILLLYVLAFFGALDMAGWVALVLAAALFLLLWKKGRQASSVLSQEPHTGQPAPSASMKEPRAGRQLSFAALRDPQLYLALALMLCAAVLASDRVVVWWDDLNYWASDVKALWTTGGFAGRYGNVSPSFGDYPPALSLWKRAFLSLSPAVFREGLQYSAYHVLNMIFMLPLLKVTRRFPLPARLLAVPAVLLLPGAFCGLQFAGAAADITMGCVFGALLLTLISEEKDSRLRYARIAVYASILVLTKFTGIIWLIAAVCLRAVVRDTCPKKTHNAAVRLLTAAFPAVVWGSWMLFCLVNRRVAKLTGEAVRMARGHFALPEKSALLIRAFTEAFFLRPLHEDRNLTLDLSAGVMFAVIIISSVIILFCQKHRGNAAGARRAGQMLVWFLCTGILVYFAILSMHLTLFRTEEQYLNAYNCALSIARYGAPFLLGSSMLLLHELTLLLAESRVPHTAHSAGETQRTDMPDNTAAKAEPGSLPRAARYALLPLLLFPLLTADYAGELRAFITYRETREADLKTRENTIDEEGRIFVEEFRDRRELWGQRILFLRSLPGHESRDAAIAYEVCPIPVVFTEYDPAVDMNEETVKSLKDKWHATQIWYIEKQDPEDGQTPAD